MQGSLVTIAKPHLTWLRDLCTHSQDSPSSARRTLAAAVEQGCVERIKPVQKNQPDRFRHVDERIYWDRLIQIAS